MAMEIDYFEREEIGNVRTHQEDSHGHALGTPNGDVFVMCDGMGGHVGGKQASSMAVRVILEYLQREKYLDIQSAITDAIQFANMQILGYAGEHPEFTGMGTTACVLLIKENEAFIAHVGDSRIYLYLGKEHQLHRITKDHSYVQTLVDAGRITDEEAEHHPQKNRILKALGGDMQVTPTVNMIPIKPKKGDIFLLCSDGLSGMIQDGVMESVMSQESVLHRMGDRLIEVALNNGGEDNITVQLVEVISSPHKKRQFKSLNPQGRLQQPLEEKSILGNYRELIWWSVSIILCAVLLIGFCKRKEIGDFVSGHKGADAAVVDSLEQKIKEKDSIIQERDKKITEKETSITWLTSENSSLKECCYGENEDNKDVKNRQGSRNTSNVTGAK